MNVLSLFDGISCGQVALERAGIEYENYFASEIDKYAIQITQKNFPNTIQLGDVKNWQEWDLPKINLLIAGSPCQGFSRAGKQLNFDDPQSALFFDFVDVLHSVKPKWFLLENVKMKQEWKDIITQYLHGLQPIEINSALVSAQNRKRLYWTNISNIIQPKDKEIFVNDILEDNPPKYTRMSNGWYRWWNKSKEFQCKKKYSSYANLDKKAITMTARQYARWNGNFIYQIPRGSNQVKDVGFEKSPCISISNWQYNNLIVNKKTIRKFSCIECERLQTIPDNYTEGISNTQRYKTLGNAYTVDVIAHIFKGMQT